jgi:hypothetical protein
MEHGASYAYMHRQLTFAAADARSGDVSWLFSTGEGAAAFRPDSDRQTRRFVL